MVQGLCRPTRPDLALWSECLSHTADVPFKQVDSRFFHRLFYGFAILAFLSLVISIGGRQVGSRLAMGGHTDSTAAHEVVIGSDVVTAAANHIRFPEQRRDGIAERLDLYALWPSMEGFSENRRAAFNNATSDGQLLFLSLEERTLTRDMSGRLDLIYRKMITDAGQDAGGGLVRYKLPESAGFVDEFLFVGELADGRPFVARCLESERSDEALAACNRDIHVGANLTLMVRFPKSLLADWRKLDETLAAFIARTVKTGPEAG